LAPASSTNFVAKVGAFFIYSCESFYLKEYLANIV